MEEIRGRRAMVCCPQMATKTEITAGQYLETTFEHDAEFVHGEIVARPMPDNTHSRIQFLILMAIGRLIQSHPLFPRPELRVRLNENLYRVPDIAVFAGLPPAENVPSSPPLLVVEILSPDDRYHDLMEKLEEYRVWGVANIWVVDPLSKHLAIYSETGLRYVQSLDLADYPLQLTPSAVFEDL